MTNTTLIPTTSTTTSTKVPTATSSRTASNAAITDTTILLGAVDIVRATAATLAFLPSTIGKNQTRIIRTRDREGNVQTITTVVGLQSTICAVTGRLLGRAIGTNEHQTIVDDRFERVGTAVINGQRIQLWLGDAVDGGYSQRIGSVVNHYSVLGEFCGYSTCEANDNALATVALAA